MTRADSERLMQYLDGELDAAQAAEVERLLAESPEAQAVLGDLEALGGAVHAIGLERTAGLPDQTVSIMERVAREPAPNAPPSASVLRFSRYWAPAGALALAAAAAFALFLRPAGPPLSVRSPGSAPELAARAPEVTSAVATVPADEVEPSDEGEGAEIESVDFGSQSGSIFMVASGRDVTPVVWLMDETTAPGGRIEPL